MAKAMRIVSLGLAVFAIFLGSYVMETGSRNGTDMGWVWLYIIPAAAALILLFWGIARLIDNTDRTNDLLEAQLNTLKAMYRQNAQAATVSDASVEAVLDPMLGKVTDYKVDENGVHPI